ncbi:MAG: pilus assembly protein [Giesbergeria sp.]
MNILKYALTQVFSDTTLIPDNKIRLGWQAMHNNGNSINRYQDLNYWYGSGANPGKGKTPGANDVGSTSSTRKNYIRQLDTTHRANFLAFVDYLLPQNGTPSHLLFQQADKYLRDSALNVNSPWAAVPGTTATPYLGCRRNYNIVMSDGRWNGTDTAVPDLNYRDNVTNLALKDGKIYGGTAPGIEQTALYRDTSTSNYNTLADWAFFSWAKPLKSDAELKDTDKLKTPRTYDEAPATESFTSGAKTVALGKYWNPKYNPATWPHMVTYTIGFSDEAVTWPGSTIVAPTQKVPFGYDGSFPNFVTGTSTWPEMDNENKRALDLWHAALNGRGRFYAVNKGEDLEKAFREIIGVINDESAALPDTVSAGSTASGFNTTRSNAGNFASAYNAKDFWRGWVSASAAKVPPPPRPCPTVANPAKMCNDYVDPTTAWAGKTTADRLDELPSLASRLVLSWSDEWTGTQFKGGTSFEWATDESNLSAAQKALLGKETADPTATVATKGENILNFIRGDRTLEIKPPPAVSGPFRERKSRQGDIINSEIWFTGRPASNYALPGYSEFITDLGTRTPMLYVGGNDGMLHGFSAVDGTEKLAYVPRGIIGDLKKLADPNYNHEYYVDGSPMVGDIKVGAGSTSADWQTHLVGTLGAGGKGYFVLDVTQPSTFSTATAKQIVATDRTRGKNEVAPDCNRTGITAPEKAECLVVVEEDADIGSILAKPVRDSVNQARTTQIARLNNNRWAVLLGNGYNSKNQRPVLLVQYLDGNKELKRVPASDAATGTGIAKDNGLTTSPALIDLNGDNRIDIAYAGDNLGNMWKFDLTSETDGDWKSAFGLNVPLFTARGPLAAGGARDQAQPITAPPIIRTNDRSMVDGPKTVAVGGMMVSFGTGRNATKDDRDVKKPYNTQSLYSVVDNARYRIKDKTKPKDDQRLEIHPGDVPNGIPVPKVVGTMGAGAKLAQQVFDELSPGNETIKPATTADDLKAETWKNFSGWYLDFPATGERLLNPMQFWDGSNILAVYSESPSATKSTSNTNTNESCTPTTVATLPGLQYRSLINIMDGRKPTVQLVGGVVPVGTVRIGVPVGTPILTIGIGAGGGRKMLDYTGIKNPDKPREDNPMPEQTLRPSWRQVK